MAKALLTDGLLSTFPAADACPADLCMVGKLLTAPAFCLPVSAEEVSAAPVQLLRGAPLKIETLPAVTHCEGCGENYPTVRHGRTCPCCGSEKTWLLRGNEISIKEIEAI